MQEMKDLLGALTPTQRWARAGMRVGFIAAAAGMMVPIVAVIVGLSVAGVPWWVIVIVAAACALFTAGICGAIYYFFGNFLRMVGKPQVEAGELQETGEPAEAVILRVEDTGITVNNIFPQIKLLLEVRPRGRPPYQAETMMLIRRLDIPRFQPGAVVPVMVDTSDPNRVAVGEPAYQESPDAAMGTEVPGISASPAGANFNAAGAEAMLAQINASNLALLARGTPAQAKIMSAQPLGILVNGNNPAMRFQLEVYPPDRPAFQAEAIGVVAEASVPKYSPGRTVFVKFDPADTSQVTLDHS